jgi:hypothetical protein
MFVENEVDVVSLTGLGENQEDGVWGALDPDEGSVFPPMEWDGMG